MATRDVFPGAPTGGYGSRALALSPRFDLDSESLFVRQAYLVGEDAFDEIKKALRPEIDETAWAELNSTISSPGRRL